MAKKKYIEFTVSSIDRAEWFVTTDYREAFKNFMKRKGRCGILGMFPNGSFTPFIYKDAKGRVCKEYPKKEY